MSTNSASLSAVVLLAACAALLVLSGAHADHVAPTAHNLPHNSQFKPEDHVAPTAHNVPHDVKFKSESVYDAQPKEQEHNITSKPKVQAHSTELVQHDSFKPKTLACNYDFFSEGTCNANYPECVWCAFANFCFTGPNCLYGEYWNAATCQCTACPANTYTNTRIARSCTACPNGGFTLTTGASICYAPFFIGKTDRTLFVGPSSCGTDYCWGDHQTSNTTAAKFVFAAGSDADHAKIVYAASTSQYIQYYGYSLMLTANAGYNCGSITWKIASDSGEWWPLVPQDDANYPLWVFDPTTPLIVSQLTPHLNLLCPLGYHITGNYNTTFCQQDI